MTQNSLKINQNKSDPNWNFMNNLTSKEIQDIIQEAMKEDGLI